MPDTNVDLASHARVLLEKGTPTTEVIAALQRRGATVMETIIIVRGLTQISLREAKELIHDSGAWGEIGRDSTASYDRLLDALDRSGERVAVDGSEYLRVQLPADPD